jgi:hypothetical protein
LHIDYDESRILGPQIPIEGPGIRVGRDVPFGNGAIRLLTLDPTTSNAVPTSVPPD